MLDESELAGSEAKQTAQTLAKQQLNTRQSSS